MSSTNQLSELLLRWEDARQRGESITLDDLCRDCPQHLPELRERVAALASLDSLLEAGPTSAPIVPGAPPLPTSPQAPSLTAAGRYRPVRPHARGGLGEVLVAEDGELHRPVALKRIREGRADDSVSRRRFLREAAITARLQHPGIVPVYGLTYDEAGRPNYAMRFVEGESLQDAITRYFASAASQDASTKLKEKKDGGDGDKSGKTPSPPSPLPRSGGEGSESALAFRELLSRFVAVCNTIAYAHSQGVLHRDLKPANVMLGNYGETLVVDWGLAKSLTDAEADADPVASDAPATSDSTGGGMTATGQALGTPAYMSPEQAAGAWDELGPASDVFGLGATLYAILTGKPPYHGRYAISVLEKARRGDYLPPRQVQPNVPAALEAICLKAMEFNPEDRYSSALDLAADVERWLADEPASAYRDPWRERVRRWAKRHRPWVAGAIVLMLTSAAALVVIAILSERSRRDIVHERDAARDERNRAVAARARTRAALDDMTSPEANRWLTTQKKLLPEQEAFLKSALKYYEEFASETGADEETQVLLAKAHARVGLILNSLGKPEKAEAAYRRAVALYQRLADEQKGVAFYRQQLAINFNDLAIVLYHLGQWRAAEENARQAIRLYERLSDEFPANLDYTLQLANSLNSLAISQKELGRRAEAADTHCRAKALRELLVTKNPREPVYRATLASTCVNLALVLGDLGQSAERLASDRQALAFYEGLVREFPYEPDYRQQLAATLHNMAGEMRTTGDDMAAEASDRRALELLERLAEDFPGVPAYRQQVALSLDNLTLVLGQRDNRVEAETLCRRALNIYERLVRENRDVPLFRTEYARTLNHLAMQLRGQGKLREAVEAHRRSQELYDRLIKEFPDVPEYRDDLAAGLNNYSLLLDELEDRGGAVAVQQQALAIYERLVKDHPEVPRYRQSQAIVTNNLGKYAYDRQDKAAALEWYARSISVLEPMVAGQAAMFPSVRRSLRNAHQWRAKSFFDLNQHAEAVPHWDRWMEIAGNNVETHLLTLRMISLARSGDYVRAAAAADALAAIKEVLPNELVDCACIYSIASAKHKETSQADVFADRAIALLQQAIAKGFKDAAHIKKEPDLDALRGRPDFQRILADLDK